MAPPSDVVPSGFFVLQTSHETTSLYSSVGTWDASSRLEPDARPNRRQRLDPDHVFASSHTPAQDPTVRREIPYLPNPSLQRNDDLFVLIETRFRGRDRSHHLIVLDASEALDAVLRRAVTGATVDELVRDLQALLGSEVPRADVEAFADELIDSQVLVPETVPTLTGADPGEQLLATCGEHPALQSMGDRLRRDGPFQTDLIRPGRCELGPGVAEEIQRILPLLDRFPRPPQKQSLDRFRDALVERYGEHREVPLTTVFDPEAGLDFGPTPGHTARRIPPPGWLVERVRTARDRNDFEIVVEEGDLGDPDAEHPLPPLPDAFQVMASVATGSPEALDRGDFRLWFRGLSGPSGACLLGPLCHADETLRRHVEAHLRQEESLDPEAIFAEIVHWPEGRSAASATRPRLRPYEIPVFSHASVDEDHQIPLDDLLVRVAADGRIVLRSARLGRRVEPRLSAPHYFGGSPHAVYRFLGAVQSQGVLGGWSWTWGSLATEDFLPRVRMGRVVWAPAQWRIPASEIGALANPSYRTERRLPRWVVRADLAMSPPLDLEDSEALETLLADVRRDVPLGLVEMFPGPDELLVRTVDGCYANSLIVPFVRTARSS